MSIYFLEYIIPLIIRLNQSPNLATTFIFACHPGDVILVFCRQVFFKQRNLCFTNSWELKGLNRNTYLLVESNSSVRVQETKMTHKFRPKVFLISKEILSPLPKVYIVYKKIIL